MKSMAVLFCLGVLAVAAAAYCAGCAGGSYQPQAGAYPPGMVCTEEGCFIPGPDGKIIPWDPSYADSPMSIPQLPPATQPDQASAAPAPGQS